jgi:anti-sigma B factor antagonist
MDILEISRLDGVRGLRLAGELDLQSAPKLTEALANMQGDGPATLDLSELTFMDSSGLHAIVAFARADNGRGRLILEGASATMLQMFEITNLAQHPHLDIRGGADRD